MVNNLKDFLDLINCNCFKNEEELYNYLVNILKGYDLIDLLEKLSCLRFLLQTTIIEYDGDRNHIRQIFDTAFTFLYCFSICYKIENGNLKINCEQLCNICFKISNFLLVYNFNDDKENERIAERIDYIQNNLTDLFGDLKRIPVGEILQCENKLIMDKYNVSTEQLLEELIDVFPQKIYASICNKKSITLKDFVDNYDLYVNVQDFIIKQSFASYAICNDLSVGFGELSHFQFNISNPLSIINLSRKLFIKNNGILYNINDDLICGRLNRSIESLFKTSIEKEKWSKNYKEKTETVIKEVFDSFLPGGIYYQNNYYKDKNGNMCENDGLFCYHNFIFCIEIKGNKFNPDPIKNNYDSVKTSYQDVIDKVKKQTVRIMNQFDVVENFLILNSHGKVINTIQNVSKKKIIGICIYFEDIGTMLVELSKEKDKIIHISFYDLLIVFNYLKNPFLIVKYLFERSKSINDRRYHFNDEMIFLSLFRNFIHLTDFINSKSIPNNSNISDIYFDNEDFGMEIELYLMGCIAKPKIEINDLIMKIITTNDYFTIDNDLFIGLFSFICSSKEKWNLLEDSYKEKNNSKVRLPLAFVFTNNGGNSYALMIISREHNSCQKKQNITYVKKYFDYRKNIDKIYLITIGKNYSEYIKINRVDKSLEDINNDISLSNVEFKESYSWQFE